MKSSLLTPVIVVSVAAAWGCSSVDGPSAPPLERSGNPPLDLVVTEPVRTTTAFGTRSAVISGAGEDRAYVSLPPATVTGAVEAQITNLRTLQRLSVPVVDGGFDPVSIGAEVGDSIRVALLDIEAMLLFGGIFIVPLREPPVVVRTVPPRGKVDVPLGGALLVVFSEPMDPRTISRETIRLLKGAEEVAGTVTLSADGIRAQLIPEAELEPETTYLLLITREVADRNQDSLVRREEIEFTTEPPPAPVASVSVTPDDATALTGAKIAMQAVLKDSAGNVLTGRPVTWSFSNDTVAAFDPFGWLRLHERGTVTVTATSEGHTGSATVTAEGFVAVSAGSFHSCALTDDGRAYCWGNNYLDNLGYPRTNEGCSFYVNGSNACSARPQRIDSPMSFASLTLGEFHTCGLTPSGTAYCWGWNSSGDLGDGTFDDSKDPVRVATPPLSFTSLASGLATCGIASDTNTYCWGYNAQGQLGNGSSENSAVPLLVKADSNFSHLSVGIFHACALTADGSPYCWGAFGGLEIGIPSPPTPIDTELEFASVSSGREHACAVTDGGAAYCWGSNEYGQLGDGTTVDTTLPVAVAGGIAFAGVGAGARHSCGLTPGGDMYCWGGNSSGQLGNGNTVDSGSPVRVAVDQAFSTMAIGKHHACGLTGGGAVYCWGAGWAGQTGTGDAADKWTPALVWPR